ncbi:hypothetical protein C0995_003878 [Termitomyces sp. Mi166|nr:hypothetical protein C0995_003878 [Termitomyces sp. Mi166\
MSSSLEITNGLERLTDGGLYIIVFLGWEPGRSHWGLYHHYNIEWVPSQHSVGQGRYIPRGHKYHIRNAGSDGKFIPDHAPTSGVLNSMYLIGLMLIGVVPRQYQTSLENEIRSFDHLVSITPDMRCRTWTLDTIQRLIAKGFVRNSFSRQEIEDEIQQFTDNNWDGAYRGARPRPISH